MTGAPDLSGTTDAATGTGCAGLPLCEDFEGVAAGGPPDPTRWSVVSPNCSGTGTVTVDGAVAHGGRRSLRVDGKGGYCNHVFIANSAALKTIAAAGPTVYGRFYLRLATTLAQDHVTFLAMKDNQDSGKDLRMGGQSGILMWNRESDDATLPELSPAGIALSQSPPAGAWRCVEFQLDSQTGLLKTFVEGAAIPGLIVDGVATPDVDTQWLRRANWRPAPVDLRLGWESYGGAAMTLWFDDVALSSQRIGCS